MSLEDSSREIVTINTHRGLYRYTRLPFGVASAPALFQQVMDTVLQGLPKVMCYLDDILVNGSSEEEHNTMLGRCYRGFSSMASGPREPSVCYGKVGRLPGPPHRCYWVAHHYPQG